VYHSFVHKPERNQTNPNIFSFLAPDKKIKAMVSEHSLSEYADTIRQLREQMAGSSAECARAVEEARVSKAALASSVEMVSEIENRVEELEAQLNEKVGQLSRAQTLQEELQVRIPTIEIPNSKL
jgi:chromosome segregation ATPase